MADPTPDSHDLRTGVPIHDALLALLPLVGRWRGSGRVTPPDGSAYDYGQELSIVHDGRPFLAYESRSWLVDERGATIRSAWRESGFWRPGSGPDDIELVVASNTGQSMVFLGTADDGETWTLRSAAVVGTPTAVAVEREDRLYGVRAGALLIATLLTVPGSPPAPHLDARLERAAPGRG